MSNKFSQEEINNYLANREQYKQNYLINRQKNIYKQILNAKKQDFINQQNFKKRVLTDMYLGNSKFLKRAFNSDPNFVPSLVNVLKNIN